MKKRILFKILLLAGIILLIFSCDFFLSIENSKAGSLVITIKNEPQNKTSKNIHSWPNQIASYEATGQGPNGARFHVNWNPGESCIIESIVSGNWMIEVSTKNEKSDFLMRGTAAVTVLPDRETSANVTLTYIPGTGSVTFKIIWPQEADVISGAVTMDSNTQAFELDMLNRTAEYTYTSVAAGMNHSFLLELLNPFGGKVFGTSGTVHVTNAVETPVIIDIFYYMNPPGQPQNTQIAIGSFCLDLNWTDVQGETGYIIENRLRGEKRWQRVNQIEADITSYRDIDVAALSDYEYRIIAYNDISENAGEIVSISTPEFSNVIVKSPIAFGETNGYRVLDDGRVIGYGWNERGQLGSYASEIEIEGIVISGLANILSIKSSSKSDATFMAIDSSGKLWMFDPRINDTPYQISGVTRQIIDIEISNGSYYALDVDGKVWVWGRNYAGQLGNGTTKDILEPVINEYYPKISAISAGDTHFLALAVTGTVFVSGYNYYGQLGLGDTTNRLIPEKVPAIDGDTLVCSHIYANGQLSFLIMEDGSIMAAGANHSYSLGLPSRNTKYKIFTPIPGLSNIVDVQNINTGTIALDKTGYLFGVGSSDIGILLEYTSETVDEFTVLTKAPGSVTSIFAGANKFYCEDSSGNHYAWGKNVYGELMTGTTPVNVWPEEQTLPSVFKSIVGGDNHYLAIDEDGDVWGWGNNEHYQFGDGTKNNKVIPEKIFTNNSDAVQIVAHLDSSSVLLEDGSSYFWGHDWCKTPRLNDFPNLSGGVIEITLGASHSLFRKNDGTVWARGSNSYGQLGNGTTYDSSENVVQVLGVGGASPLADVVKINTYLDYNNAILANGAVVSWGGSYAMLGLGSDIRDSLIPAPVSYIKGAQQLYSGRATVFCIDSSDTLWMWGSLQGIVHSVPMNYKSQYGNPGQAIKKIVFGNVAGDTWALFLLEDGTLRIQGLGMDHGLSGTGYIYQSIPTGSWPAPVGPNQIIDIASTNFSCAALSSSGTLWTWGMNDYGQAANGTVVPQYNSSPIKLVW